MLTMKNSILLITMCLQIHGCLMAGDPKFNWKLIKDTYYYKVEDKNFTFNEAQEHCRENGGKLAEPQNIEESDNLDNFPEINGGWIGIKRNQNCTLSYASNNATIEESWPRMDQNSICSPSNVTKCGAIDTLSTEWNFFDCKTTKTFFICERTKAATIMPTTTSTTIMTPTNERSLIMVATGSNWLNYRTNYKDLVQVVDLNSNTLCSNLQKFPSAIEEATGAVLNNIPIICGGQDNRGEYQNSCFAYEKSSQSWLLHAKMKNRRYGASTTVINGALWVSGGRDTPNGDEFASSEYIYPNGTVTEGPTMPSGRSNHCTITLHDNRIIIIGGFPRSNLNSVLVFDPDNNSFNPGPSLLYDRVYDGCALFSSAKHGGRPVVLSAGGSAEILDYTVPNAVWERSKHICHFCSFLKVMMLSLFFS